MKQERLKIFCPACTIDQVMKMKLDILYKDAWLTVCLKRPGLDSQEAMRCLIKEELNCDSFCVHRLDKEVGGVMVYALTGGAAAKLSEAIAKGKMKKEYLAVISGCPQQPQGLMKDLLYRDAAKNKSFVVKRMRKGVREAELEYRLLEHREDKSLVRVRLHTGRSHQIRVQFASRGLPLLGDAKYGSRERACNIALWSCHLEFPHPDTGVMMKFSALPEAVFPWNLFQNLFQGE